MKHGSRGHGAGGGDSPSRTIPKGLLPGFARGGVALAAALLVWSPASQARVTKLVIDNKVSPAFSGQDYPAGSGRQYETIAGRVYGELDPNDPHNTIINDLAAGAEECRRQGRVHGDVLPRQADRHVQEQPTDVAGRAQSRRADHACRGQPQRRRHRPEQRLAGRQLGRHRAPPAPGNTTTTPSSRSPTNADGSPITGVVMGRILNAERRRTRRRSSSTRTRSPTSRSRSTPARRRWTTHDHETNEGIVDRRHHDRQQPTGPGRAAARRTRSRARPIRRRSASRAAFDPTSCTRSSSRRRIRTSSASARPRSATSASFFKYEMADDYGTPNPVGRQVSSG